MNTRRIERILGLILVLSAVALPGCELVPPPGQNPPETGKAPAAPANSDSNTAKFLEIAARPTKDWDITAASLLATQMARSGPNGLDSLFNLLADPAAKGEAKVLVSIVLTPLVQKTMIPRLTAMTQPGQNLDTRSCATQLLGMLQDPEASKRVRELSRDPELRVQVTAVYCLMRRDDTEAMQLALELWKRPDLNANQRVTLVQEIPVSRAAMMTPICRDAALDTKLSANIRTHAVEVLMRAGTEDVIPILQQCSQTDPEPRLQAFAKAGLDALRAGKQVNAVSPATPAAPAPAASVAPVAPVPSAEAPASGTPAQSSAPAAPAAATP